MRSAAPFFRNSDQQGQNNSCRNRFGSRRYATWCHPKSKLPFQLDHILVRGSDMRRIMFCGVRQSLAINSDHIPILASINLGSIPKPTVRPQQPRLLRPDLSALGDSSVKAEFASKVAARCVSVPPGQRVSSEETAAALRNNLMATAVEVLGKQRRKSPDWFERCKVSILEAIDARNQAHVACNRSPRNQATKAVLKHTRRVAKALVRDAKKAEKLRILSALNGDNNN